MMMDRSVEYLLGLVRELCTLTGETEWVEFKERVRAVYFHVCLRYVSGDYLTNASLRQRFGIDARNRARASRLITEAVEAGATVPDDPAADPKFMRYVPEWAGSGRRVGYSSDYLIGRRRQADHAAARGQNTLLVSVLDGYLMRY